jgi:tetratricopeptide (TPR) repeat protein/predicted AlkP superfamily phosphohydrolase/phosphomutase
MVVLVVVSVLVVTAAFHVPEHSIGVRRSRLGGVAVLDSGWHFSSRLLNRHQVFPAGERTLPFGTDSGNLTWQTAIGAQMEADGTLEYTIGLQELKAALEDSAGDLDGHLREQLAAAFKEVTRDSRFQPLQPSQKDEVRDLVLAHLTSLSLRSLTIDRIGLVGSDALLGFPQATNRRKLLWLAVDSFDWDIIDPLIADGRMPRVAALKKQAAWGNLETITPILSPVVWTSMATGKLPQKHGIFDFIAEDPTTGAVVPVTSSLRKTEAFWNIFSHGGVSVGVVAWWATFPAEPVRGFMATDRISYQLFKDKISDSDSDGPLKTHPSDLFARIKSAIVPPNSIADDALTPFLAYDEIKASFSADDRERVNELRTVLAATETYHSIATDLFESIETDIRVLYYEAPDTAGHLFMPFVPPTEHVDAERVTWFGRVVPQMYVQQDRWIGEMIDRFTDDETLILITSDHGFKTGDERPTSDARIGEGKAAECHTRDGIFLIAGPDILPDQRLLGASILDVLPTLLALYGLPVGEDMDGKVLETAFDSSFLEEHPIGSIPTYDLIPWEERITGGSLSAAASEEHLEKLRSLGYIQQSSSTADINRGSSALAAGDYEESIRAYRAVLAQGEKIEIRLSLARALRLAKRYDECEIEVKKVLASGQKTAEAHTELSALARNRGDLERASEEVAKALAADPENIPAWMQRAIIAETRNNTDEALRAYRKVLEITPEDDRALNQIGVLLRRSGRIDEAIVAMKQAIEKNPDRAAPYNNLGLLYYTQQRPEQAIETIELGLTMRPNHPVLLNSLGTVRYQQNRIEEAIEAFRAAVEADGAYAESISNLAVIYQGLNDVANTEYWLKRQIEVEPVNGEPRVSLALLHLREGQLGDAIRVLEESVAVIPDDLQSLIVLGEVLARNQRPGDALPYLEHARDLDPQLPNIWNMLGNSYSQLGRGEDARQAFTKSLALNPDQPQVRSMRDRLSR